MIRLTVYELRKLWCKKSFLLGVLAVLFMNLLLLFVNSQISPDINAGAYKKLLGELSGKSMEEKSQLIEGLYEKIDGLYTIDGIFRLESSTGISDYTRELRKENAQVFARFLSSYTHGHYLYYTDNLWAEHSFISKIKNEMDAVADYDGYLTSIEEKADSLSQISIFKTQWGDSFSEKSIRAQARAYAGLKSIETDYLPEEGLMSALEFRLSDVLLIVFVLLAASVLLQEEKDSQMLALNFSMPRGRGLVGAAKLLAVFLSLLVAVWALYTMNLCYYHSIYGIGDIFRPLQSVPSLMSCPWKLTIGEYLILFMTAKWVSCVLIAVWLMLCTYLGKNIYTGWGLGLAFIGLNYIVRLNISGIGPWNMLRYINIFSLMNTNELLGTSIQLYFFGNPVPVLLSAGVGGLLIFLGLSVLFLWLYHTGAGLNLRGAFSSGGFMKAHFGVEAGIFSGKRRPFGSTLMAHECYKLLKMNGMVWIILAFLLFLVYSGSRGALYKSFDEEIYEDYMVRWGGRFTEETANAIARENERFAPLYALEDALALGQLTPHQYEESRSLYGALDGEKKVFDMIVEEKLSYMKEHPSAWLVYDTGYEKLFDLENEDDIYELMLLFLVLILGFGSMFSCEKMSGMETVLAAAPLGRRALSRVKLKLSFRLSAALVLASLIPRYIIVGISYGFPQLLAPANSLFVFSVVPSWLRIYHMLLLQLVCRILAAWAALCLIHWLSLWLKNTLSVFFAAAILLELCPVLYICSVKPMIWLSLWPLFHYPAILQNQVPWPMLALYALMFLGLSAGAGDAVINNFGVARRTPLAYFRR